MVTESPWCGGNRQEDWCDGHFVYGLRRRRAFGIGRYLDLGPFVEYSAGRGVALACSAPHRGRTGQQ